MKTIMHILIFVLICTAILLSTKIAFAQQVAVDETKTIVAQSSATDDDGLDEISPMRIASASDAPVVTDESNRKTTKVSEPVVDISKEPANATAAGTATTAAQETDVDEPAPQKDDTLSPFSFFLGYGVRRSLDRDLIQEGTAGVEYRLLPSLSAQLLASLGIGIKDQTNSYGFKTPIPDIHMMIAAGLKWAPLSFQVHNHLTEAFFTGGAVTGSSSASLMRDGSALFAGTGLTYYFEPNVKGVVDFRFAPGVQGFEQLVAGINFQFP